MDKDLVCFGTNIFSYNTDRLIRCLNNKQIAYQYYNIFDNVNNLKHIDVRNKKIMLVEHDLLLYKEDFDSAPSALFNTVKSSPGVLYGVLRLQNAQSFNHIDNHFKIYNKWSLYNLLCKYNIDVPLTYPFARSSDMKSDMMREVIERMKAPFIVRSNNAQDRNNSQKFGFICTGYEDLARFYEESLLAGQHYTYIIQQYIPHDAYITANVTYKNIRYFATESKTNVSLPLKNTKRYNDWVLEIQTRLKLNCFSVSFIPNKNKNLVIKLKVPGELALTDLLFGVDTTSEIVKGFLHD